MFETTHFGIEVEFTGITRQAAAEAVAKVIDGTVRPGNRCMVAAPDGRVWKIVDDVSITPQRKNGGRRVSAGGEYRCELVSPILTYHGDIDTIQASTYLNRIGFIGDEFKSCRDHLCQHLDSNGAWRFGEVNGRSVRTIRTEDSDNA